MSASRQIAVALALGVFAGLFFGDRIGVLEPLADAYLKLIQMMVLPYVVVSLVSGLGSLTHAHVRLLGLRAGAVLLLLWSIALVLVFTFPLMFPRIESASFFSSTLLDPPPPFNFVDLYIP